jgi:pimeloyl-ACP methyl ester carboxylesterase
MENFTLNHRQYSIQVYKSGSGMIPLVLLHGAGLDSAMLSWKEVMAALPAGYTVYAIDMLGYGESDKPPDIAGDAFYEKHLSCLEDVVSQLGLSRFCLSGISMGGAFAIGYAFRRPDQIAALVPIDAWGLVSKLPCQWLYDWIIHTSLQKHMYRWIAKSPSIARWIIRSTLFGDPGRITRELVDEIVTLCDAPGVGAAMHDFQVSSLTRRSVKPDYTKRLSGLEAPTLFINGEKDMLVPVKASERASEAAPQGELYVMRGCKHWPQKERPEEYIRIADAFIQKVW